MVCIDRQGNEMKDYIILNREENMRMGGEQPCTHKKTREWWGTTYVVSPALVIINIM